LKSVTLRVADVTMTLRLPFLFSAAFLTRANKTSVNKELFYYLMKKIPFMCFIENNNIVLGEILVLKTFSDKNTICHISEEGVI
jgi:hypothetical protein